MIPLLLLSSAFAVSQYPGMMESDLGMPCAPTCDVCHSTAGGGGVPTQSFGTAMVDRGLTANTSSLTGALDQMASDGVDSDGDGSADLDELAAGQNPNAGGSDFCPDGGGPVYGCLSSAPSPGTGWGWVLGLLLVGVRRRR